MIPENSRLAHRTGAERRGNITITQYETWPIMIDRPERGAVTARLACGTCAHPVEVTVSSARRRLVRKLAYLALGVAGLIGFIATVHHFLTAPVNEEVDGVLPDAPPTWLLLLGTVGAPLAAIWGFVFAHYEEGVRRRLRGSAGHSIRRTGRSGF